METLEEKVKRLKEEKKELLEALDNCQKAISELLPEHLSNFNWGELKKAEQLIKKHENENNI